MSSPHDVDRNLLFGLLALQNGFISREDLVAATSTWLEDKSQRIGAVLLDRGAISADIHRLLVALTDKHVEKHDNDPEKSLAALSSIGSVRNDLADLGDAEVGHSMSRVSMAPEDPIDYTTEVVSFSPPTSESRFRILRPHAKGGLGKVSVAQDSELHREVALKEILAKHAFDPHSRSRFMMEAEITGGLEHPGIVPVYGLGQYDDGRPYYAMRLIRGDSLREAIQRFHKNADAGHSASVAQRALELRQLLGRFLDVCQAIDYAHSRGVLHRDLKPGNIMLGRYGETLVVDWGLAKSGSKGADVTETDERTLQPPSVSGSAPTIPGSTLGTPQYMSPEQAAGKLDELGPASDVYSLGATLYCLLTGKPPIQVADVATVLRRVCLGDFPPPREVNPDVPAALEAVCLKAMANRPRDRYTTARLLIDDIERWMADEPVSAWREPLAPRVSRWIRKHQSIVTAGVAATCVTLAALTIGIMLQSAAREREKSAKESARANFELAQNAVDRFYTRVSEDTLLNQPGMHALRQELLSEALDYYQSLLDDHADDANLRDEAAIAQFRVGRIIEDIESPSSALVAYEQARDRQQQLVSRSPDDQRLLVSLSTTWNAIGRVHHILQNYGDAKAAYVQAETIRQQLVRDHPQVGEHHRLLANSLMNVGMIEQIDGNLAAANQQFENAQSIRRKRIDQGDQDPKLLRDMGQGYWNIANLMLSSDESAALVSLEASIDVFDRLVTAKPDDQSYQARLAACFQQAGDLHFLGQPPDLTAATNSYREARVWMSKLVIRNPDVPRYKSSLAEIDMNLGSSQHGQGDLDEALRSYQNAHQILQPLTQQYPDVPTYRRDFAVTLYAEAELIESDDQAKEYIKRAIVILRELVAAFPDNTDYQQQLDSATAWQQSRDAA